MRSEVNYALHTNYTFFDGFHHSVHFFVADPRSGRNAESAAEKVFAHTVHVGRAFREEWLQMHWFPEMTAFYSPAVEVSAHGFGTSAPVVAFHFELRSEGYGAEPEVGVEFGGRVFVERDAGNVGKEFTIQFLHMAVVGKVFAENSHLSASDAGTDVAHAVVEPDAFVLIPWERLTALGGITHHEFV